MLNTVVTMKLTDKQLDRLKQRCQVVLTGWGRTGELMAEEDLLRETRDADILLVGYEAVSARVIREATGLKLIGCARATPVNIDVAAATARGIPVLYTPGRNANTAAEFTLGLMLAESRHIARAYHALRSGQYLGAPMDRFAGADTRGDVVWTLDGPSPYKKFRGVELCGRTLGLVGLGHIGARVARFARAFDMEVVAHDPYLAEEQAAALGVRLVGLDTLLGQADFISVHCKVSDETKGLLGRREFALMKPGAYVINTARAVIIDQEALVDALRERRIAGAALDVYWYEPLPANHPLLSMDNVTLTPHLGGATEDVPERHSRMIVDDVFAWLDQARPERVYNPSVLAPACP